MNYLKNKRGITLMEVIIAMAFVGLLATLAYSLQYFGLKSFRDGGNQVNIQQNVRIVSEVMRKELRNISDLTLIDVTQPVPEGYEGGYYLENQRLVKSDSNFSTDGVIEGIDITLEDLNGRVMLVYEIRGGNNYRLQDQILLNNIALEDLTDQIILGKVFSLKEYKLVFTK